jgi:RNA polymerase sigma-70 factor, ECF subfamily
MRNHSPDARSDEALLKEIAAGDQSAMLTLYARHNMRLYHFIVRLVTDAAEPRTSLARSSSMSGARLIASKAVRRFRLGSCQLRASRRCRRFIGAGIPEVDMELIEDSADTPEKVGLNLDRSAQLRICLAQ